LAVLVAVLGVAAWHFWPREPVFYAQPVGGGRFDHAHKRWAAVLAANVTNGHVNYRAIHEQPNELRAYLIDLSAVTYPDFQHWPQPQQVAFLVNLYNATTVKLIADHWPVEKLRDIRHRFKGPRQQRVALAFGRRWTLDELEDQWIKKRFHDPRLDLALCRGTLGGHPLRGEPYLPSKFDAQLAEQAALPDDGKPNDAINAAR
jgi:hypothetical protein